MTEKDVRERLRNAVEQAGGQKAFAAQHRMSAGYVNDLVNGRRLLSDRVLSAISVVRKVTYEEAP